MPARAGAAALASWWEQGRLGAGLTLRRAGVAGLGPSSARLGGFGKDSLWWVLADADFDAEKARFDFGPREGEPLAGGHWLSEAVSSYDAGTGGRGPGTARAHGCAGTGRSEFGFAACPAAGGPPPCCLCDACAAALCRRKK